VTGYSAYALAALGEGERAKARMTRALLIHPGNFNMRYNFGCAPCVFLKDKDAALDMLGPVFDQYRLRCRLSCERKDGATHTQASVPGFRNLR